VGQKEPVLQEESDHIDGYRNLFGREFAFPYNAERSPIFFRQRRCSVLNRTKGPTPVRFSVSPNICYAAGSGRPTHWRVIFPIMGGSECSSGYDEAGVESSWPPFRATAAKDHLPDQADHPVLASNV
jgi:hypothetical protein